MKLLSPGTLRMLHDASTRSQVSPDVLEALATAAFADGVRWATQDMREREEVLKALADARFADGVRCAIQELGEREEVQQGGDLMDPDKLSHKLN
jgi:hypothetical protein